LAARAGSRTGLIAFSGTAHLVMPMTEDRAVIEPFLAALTPELMPVQGNNATAAVALATTVMAAESLAGTILVIGDGIGDEAAVRRVAGRNGVLMLSVAPPSTAPISARWSAVSKPVISPHSRRHSAHAGATKVIGFCCRPHCSACCGSGAGRP